MILVFLLGCVSREPDTGDQRQRPACPLPLNEGWAPEIEDELRLSETDAEWVPVHGGIVDPAAMEGCVTAPCVTLTGPGAAETAVILNRAIDYVLTAHVRTDVALDIVLMQYEPDGTEIRVSTQTVDAGTDAEVSMPLFLTNAGASNALRLVLAEAGTAVVNELVVVGPQWKEVPVTSAEPLLLGFLIHIESAGSFAKEEISWRNKARIIEGVAGLLATHGARLTVQPDVSFIRGAEMWDPSWIEARTAEGVSWSAHIHDETEGVEGISSAARDARRGFEEAGVKVNDLNGGFGLAPWAELESAGYRSISAFKSPVTQLGLALSYTNPWRPADGAGATDETIFATHDPDGPLIYLPGKGGRESDVTRFAEYARRVLSQARAHTRSGFINTWYFVGHVDDYGPVEDEAALTAWLDDGGLEADLAPYDTFLTDVSDPLAAQGMIEYSVPSDMAFSFLDWSSHCSF